MSEVEISTPFALGDEVVDGFIKAALLRLTHGFDIEIAIPKCLLLAFQDRMIDAAGGGKGELVETMDIFAPGLYNRNLWIKQGDIVVGKVHLEQHLTTLLQGTASVMTEQGVTTYVGPASFISRPLAKRCVYAHTDCLFATYHVTTETDVAKIEDRIIMKREEYEQLAADDLTKLTEAERALLLSLSTFSMKEEE